MFQDEPRRPEESGRLWGADRPPPPPPTGEDREPVADERPSAWKKRDLLYAVILMVGGYFLLLAAVAITAALTGQPVTAEEFTLPTAVGTAVFTVYIGLIVVLLAARRGISAGWLGFVRPARWGVLPIAVVGSYITLAAYFIAVELIQDITGRDLSEFTEGHPIPPVADELEVLTWIVLGFSVVIAAPIAEELFFRGFLFRALDAWWPTVLAMMVSGFAFALVHFNISVIVPFTVIGILFAWAYKASGSLWTPIAAHAIVNGVSFLLTVVGVETPA